MKIGVLTLLLAIAQSIYIPISLYEKKCMAVFTAFEVLIRVIISL